MGGVSCPDVVAGHFTIMSSSNALPLVACRLNTVTDKDGTPAERR